MAPTIFLNTKRKSINKSIFHCRVVSNYSNFRFRIFDFRQRQKIREFENFETNAWLKYSTVSSHVEGYMCAIQEEEINTKLLRHKRLREESNPNCRLCHTQRESIQHIISCCPKLSASMYLPIRHNEVAKVIYENLTSRETKVTMKSRQEVYSNDDKEIYWDTNKPGIVLWLKKEKNAIL